MSAPWRDDRNETPTQWILRLPLVPLAWLWAAGASLHRLAYERGWLVRRSLACRVVSVGALQAGGSGKTPVAIGVARLLRDRRGGAGRVVLASRGHGRRRFGRDRVVTVSNGREILAGVAEAGDEPLLLAGQVPGVAVYVARDRGLAAEVALAEEADPAGVTLVLDDGFQHHRLARDRDLVVVDAGAGLGRACLPRGTRREGLRALARAGAIVVLDGALGPRDLARLERHASGTPRFAAIRRPRGLRTLGAAAPAPRRIFRRRSESGLTSLDQLAGREVGVFSGIGRPASFVRSVEALGARVVAERVFPDHHRYTASDLRSDWLRDAPLWLTTAKDALKLRADWARGAAVYVLDIDVHFAEPDALLAWLAGGESVSD